MTGDRPSFQFERDLALAREGKLIYHGRFHDETVYEIATVSDRLLTQFYFNSRKIINRNNRARESASERAQREIFAIIKAALDARGVEPERVGGWRRLAYGDGGVCTHCASPALRFVGNRGYCKTHETQARRMLLIRFRSGFRDFEEKARQIADREKGVRAREKWAPHRRTARK